jgi:simple sugar transport system permease protein
MSEIIQSTLLAGTPLVLGAIAGIISERAGVLNIAIEGLMLAAAFITGWVGAGSSQVVGALAGVAVGLLFGLALGYTMVALRGDQVVIGIAFNIFVLGLTSYAYETLSKGHLNAFDTGEASQIAIPGLEKIPVVGVVFDQNWITYLMYLLIPATYIVLFRSGLGVRLRACGEFAEGASATGVNVARTRILAMGVSGMVAAAAGAFLVIGDIGEFHENMTAGIGYIALTIVILGRWKPLGALIAGVLFGLAEAIGNYVQARGAHIPPQVIFALPYILGLVAVAVFGRRVRPPAEDGRPLRLPS